MSCPNCGSWAVKADRSLAGRMVCGRCGQPLGAKVIPLRRHLRRHRRRQRASGLQRPSRHRLWWLLLFALLGLSGLLAALDGGERRPLSPRDARQQRLRSI